MEVPPTTSTYVLHISASAILSTTFQVATPTPSMSSTVGGLPTQTTTSRVVFVPTPTPTSSNLIMSSTVGGLPTQTTSSGVPTPTPLYCPAESTLISKGYFDWPVTTVGGHVTIMCPNGPVGVQAERTCSVFATWGEVHASGCLEASVTTQLLADISQASDTPSSLAG